MLSYQERVDGPPLDDLPDVSFTERLTAQESSMLALRICSGIG
jgi:hypothetical protein